MVTTSFSNYAFRSFIEGVELYNECSKLIQEKIRDTQIIEEYKTEFNTENYSSLDELYQAREGLHLYRKNIVNQMIKALKEYNDEQEKNNNIPG